jgi:hypothetical protein
MLIYTPQISNRIKYVCQVIFSDVWKISHELTDNFQQFTSFCGPKINYSLSQTDDDLFISQNGLLVEKEIIDQDIAVTKWEGFPIFFQTTNEATLPFDVFSATFYLISRYEEYLPHFRDKYERFIAKESLAYKNSFLNLPLVNIWLKILKRIISKKFPDLKFPAQKFKYISTIDVDNAYCYAEKGLVRSSASFVKSFIDNDQQKIKDRWAVLTGKQKDPFDTFDIQLGLQEKYNIEVVYFILLADYGLNDKNIPVTSRKFRLLIKHLADYAEIGIHPSFASNYKTNSLLKEKKRLIDIVKRSVNRSRQHFLKLSFPFTYRELLNLDIHNDYSMGYSSVPGFRASICTPYHFYDLELESSTSLIIHPFAVMDATFNYYLKSTPKQTLEMIKEIVDLVKSVEGSFISLWHNDTWSEHEQWVGWSQLYAEMLDYIHS